MMQTIGNCLEQNFRYRYAPQPAQNKFKKLHDRYRNIWIEKMDARVQPPTRSRSLTSATSARGDAAGSVHARVTLAREFATAVNAYRTTAELDMG